MKKLIMIAALMLMSVGAFAQGKAALGVNAGVALYGDEYNPFGFGAKFQYEFVEDFRVELGYNYWLQKNKAGVMDFDLNFHYLIPINDRINFYPLVGINYGMTHGDSFKMLFGGQESIFGLQGGAGIEFFLTNNLKANFDFKYQYNKKTKSYSSLGYTLDYELKYNGPVFQVGLAYVF